MIHCLTPQKPHMCDKENCMQTFTKSWDNQESLTPHKLVDAGFYCMGFGDRIICFYCEEEFFYFIFLFSLYIYPPDSQESDGGTNT